MKFFDPLQLVVLVFSILALMSICKQPLAVGIWSVLRSMQSPLVGAIVSRARMSAAN
jgi:hypothetical protein